MSKESDKNFSYKDYVTDRQFTSSYNEYQERYKTTLRESEKKMLEIIRQERQGKEAEFRLLDIGCSTGNFLRHARGVFPTASLVGGDVAVGVIDRCKADPELTGMEFIDLDIFSMSQVSEFDVITLHAVLYMFSDDECEKALRKVSQALRPGGILVAYDFFHVFPQNLAISEKSKSHPDGLMLHFRPISWVTRICKDAQFQECHCVPFEFPMELSQGETFGGNSDGFEDLNSYTIRTQDQKNLLFRGALYQPWCHMIARR